MRFYGPVLAWPAPMLSNNTTTHGKNSANDNKPKGLAAPVAGRTEARDLPSKRFAGGLIAVSGFSPVKPKIHITRSQISQSTNAVNESGLLATEAAQAKQPRKRPKKTGRGPMYFLFALWLLILAVIAYGLQKYSDKALTPLTLTIGSAGFGVVSLILTAFAQKHRAKIVHSLGIASASLCLAVLLGVYLQTSGRIITPETLVMGLSATSLVFARIWQSPYLLNVSILLSFGWCIYGFMSYQSSEFTWLFPVLWAAQMFIALGFRISRTVLLSVMNGLFWIGVNLPLLNL